MWTGLVWLRIGTVGELFRNTYVTLKLGCLHPVVCFRSGSGVSV
jgi:hypothetical protein